MVSSGNDKDSQKLDRGATSSSGQYLPDYIRTREKHRKAPHLGTFNVGLEVTQRTPLIPAPRKGAWVREEGCLQP